MFVSVNEAVGEDCNGGQQPKQQTNCEYQSLGAA